MTDSERITFLEIRIAGLEARLSQLEFSQQPINVYGPIRTSSSPELWPNVIGTPTLK